MDRDYLVQSGSALNLRAAPGIAAPILGAMPPGTPVTRLDEAEEAGFWHVQTGDDPPLTGWAFARYLVPAEEDEGDEEVLATFSWTLQYTHLPREGAFVRAARGVELRYAGMDGQERRVPVDLDYAPSTLEAAPPELRPLQAVPGEVGWAARALLAWVLHEGKPYGTVIHFELLGLHYAGRLEHHANAQFGLSIYAFLG
jgi:hypothetical protein